MAIQVPNQSGKLAVVTGSNSGTGLWTADGLAAAGATVIMAVRTVEKGKGPAGKSWIGIPKLMCVYAGLI